MKRVIILAVASFLVAGCLRISPSQQRAFAAPLRALPEIVQAATLFRLAEKRWPQTKKELEAGFLRGSTQPEFLQDIETVTILEQSNRFILYRCLFPGGGSTEVRVNLK